MKMRYAVSLLLLAAVVAPRQASAQAAPTEREYAVWSAVVDTFLARSPRITRIVVADFTVPGDRRRAAGPIEQRSLVSPRDRTPPPAELVQAFNAANGASSRLQAGRIHSRLPVQLASQAGERKLPALDDYQASTSMRDGGYAGSPGLARLSRVGFSTDGRKALVFVNLYCGGLCAQETYFVLMSDGCNGWIVTGQYVTSQS